MNLSFNLWLGRNTLFYTYASFYTWWICCCRRASPTLLTTSLTSTQQAAHHSMTTRVVDAHEARVRGKNWKCFLLNLHHEVGLCSSDWQKEAGLCPIGSVMKSRLPSVHVWTSNSGRPEVSWWVPEPLCYAAQRQMNIIANMSDWILWQIQKACITQIS